MHKDGDHVVVITAGLFLVIRVKILEKFELREKCFRKRFTHIRPCRKIVGTVLESLHDGMINHFFGEVDSQRVFKEVDERLETTGVPSNLEIRLELRN